MSPRLWIIFSFIGAYMVLCIAVGIWAMRRTRGVSDFFVAGRSLGIWVTTLAIFSTTLSGFGFVGGPGLVYRMGASSFWIVLAVPVGYALCFSVLAKKLRALAEEGDYISISDVVAARYSSELTRFLTALAILLGVLGYMATQVLAMSMVLRDLCAEAGFSALSSLEVCAALSTAVLVFYCVTGGVVASVYTDVVQGGIMVVAAVFVFFTARSTFDGGFEEMTAVMLADGKESIGPWGTLGIAGCLSWYLLFSVGMCGQPHIVSKFMMNRSANDARWTLPLTNGVYAIATLLWIGIGLAMRSLVLAKAEAPLGGADEAAAVFLQHYAHPVLAGVVLAGLFAAIMSTADAFLNIGAAALVHDIPLALLGRKLKRELLAARVATALLAVFSAVFAVYSFRVNAELVAFLGTLGWGLFAAAFVPLLAIGLHWPRANATAANVSILVGLFLNLSAQLTGQSMPFGIHSATLALVGAMASFLLVAQFRGRAEA